MEDSENTEDHSSLAAFTVRNQHVIIFQFALDYCQDFYHEPICLVQMVPHALSADILTLANLYVYKLYSTTTNDTHQVVLTLQYVVISESMEVFHFQIRLVQISVCLL